MRPEAMKLFTEACVFTASFNASLTCCGKLQCSHVLFCSFLHKLCFYKVGEVEILCLYSSKLCMAKSDHKMSMQISPTDSLFISLIFFFIFMANCTDSFTIHRFHLFCTKDICLIEGCVNLSVIF